MKTLYKLLVILFFSFTVNAQSPGDLDSTFGTNGVQSYLFADCDSRANSLHLYNGSIYVGGYLEDVSDCANGLQRGGISKLDTNGILDASFNSSGSTNDQSMFWPHSLLNPMTGKLILTGYDRQNTNSDFEHSRIGFDANGVIDTSFVSGRIALGTNDNERSRANAISPITGEFITVGFTQNNQFLVGKFLADGNVDVNFGIGGFAFDLHPNFNGGNAYAGLIQSDGKVLIAGGLGSASLDAYGLIRYDENGTLDPTFGSGGFVSINNQPSSTFHRCTGIVQQDDGKIVGAGFYDNGTDNTMTIFRLNTDGSLDSSFATNGSFSVNRPGATLSEGLAIQGDGKILAVIDDANQFLIVRLNPNGTIDNTFGNNGYADWSIPGYDQIRLVEIGVMDGSIYALGFAVIANTAGYAVLAKLRAFDSSPLSAPVAGFVYNTNNVTLSFTDTSSNNPIFWNWDFGDGTNDNIQNPSHTYSGPGTYTVQLVAGNSFGKDTFETTISILGLNEDLNDFVNVSPNPFNDEVKFEFQNFENEKKEIGIYNLQGKLLLKETFDEGMFIWRPENLPKGVYTYKIKLESGSMNGKLIFR